MPKGSTWRKGKTYVELYGAERAAAIQQNQHLTRIGQHRIHGHAPASGASPTYRIWTGIIKRCTNPSCASFAKYGGKLCKRWENFPNFLADMGPRPSGMSIDRIDNDGIYEPGNCRWATRRQQNLNTRRNMKLTFNGITKTVVEWAEENGISRYTVWARIHKLGWPPELAVTEKVHR